MFDLFSQFLDFLLYLIVFALAAGIVTLGVLYVIDVTQTKHAIRAQLSYRRPVSLLLRGYR